MICNMRSAVLMLWLLATTALSAQNISVSSFKMLENDLTANTTGTMQQDQNGETAALIKVVTTQQGFVFDGGMVGIVKTRQEVGEVWVYVPHGIKRITIKHPTLGVLRDYYFPIPIEKARTYEMVLATGRVETVVTHSVNKQFVMFTVKPTHAIVELGDEMLEVDAEGYATKGVPYGTYEYRVSCANYHTEAGRVTVTKEGKAEVNVTLRPNFGWIKMDAAEALHGAQVYIDNERVGQLPLTTEELKSGPHQIRVVKSLYKTYTREVTVKDNETTELTVDMVPNFATITLVADDGCEIWVDGVQRGQGRWSGPLEMGEYTVEVKKASHRTVSEIVHVTTAEERTVQLKSPIPLYASLEILSSPLRATVYIDGVEVGETPLIKSDVLAGTHKVTFEKQGYGTVEKEVTLVENTENTLSAELRKENEAAAEDKPEEEKNSKPAKPDTKKKEPTQKPKIEEPKQRIIVGAGGSYSPYGMSYGGQLGMAVKRFSLLVGAQNYMMGKYTAYEGREGYAAGRASAGSVELLRFSAKVGYTLPVGRCFRITPQVGVVFAPCVLKGKEYVMGEVVAWDEVPYDGYKAQVLAPDADYTAMNRNINQFARMQYGVAGGLRLELTTPNSRLGLHVTPEYVMGEGLAVGAGVVVRL